MQDAERVVGHRRLDEQAALGIPGRRGVMDRPVAAAGQRLAGETVVVDQHVERDLIRHVGRALQGLAQQLGPALPVRRIGLEREDTRVDQRKADQPVGRFLAEGGGVGRAVDRRELRPGVMVVTHRAMDFRRRRERARTRRSEEERDRIALLHPAIGIDPEIEIEARKIARQEGPSRQRLVAILELGAAGKVEVPLAARRRSRPVPRTRRVARPSARNRGCRAPSRGLPRSRAASRHSRAAARNSWRRRR